LGLANALKYLHENDIYHHNIKPENVLVFGDRTEMKWKWGDFGYETHKLQSLFKDPDGGTQSYVPPELHSAPVFGTEGILNEKWDTYSFAILIGEVYLHINSAKYYERHWKNQKQNPTEFLKKVVEGLRPYNVRKKVCLRKTKHEEPPEAEENDLITILITCWDAQPEKRELDSIIAHLRKNSYDED
jgi:serine/threonine protein kinase